MKIKKLFWLILIAIIFVMKYYSSIDNTAYLRAESLYMKDKMYVIYSGRSEYKEGKNILVTSDDYSVNEVVGDPSHTFVVVRSFLDNSLYVRDDYKIPTSGSLSFISWHGKKIVNKVVLKTLEEITKKAKTNFEYNTEAIFVLDKKQYMKPLFFAYENCPVATNFKGYFGVVSGKWIITTNISKNLKHISAHVLSKEEVEILSPFFKILTKEQLKQKNNLE